MLRSSELRFYNWLHQPLMLSPKYLLSKQFCSYHSFSHSHRFHIYIFTSSLQWKGGENSASVRQVERESLRSMCLMSLQRISLEGG